MFGLRRFFNMATKAAEVFLLTTCNEIVPLAKTDKHAAGVVHDIFVPAVVCLQPLR
jgi:hypothetical protein